MRGWKNLPQLLPSVIVAVIVMLGLKLTTPVFDEVQWPEMPVFAQERDADSEKVKSKKTKAEDEDDKTSSTDRPVNSYSDPGDIEESAYEDTKLKDGVYIGSAQGFGGQITVQVTVKKEKMTDITVLDHSGETESYYQKAIAIINTILRKQTPNVDTISGATYSSNGIREAVKNALKKAAAGDQEESETESESKEETKETKEKETEEEPQAKDGVPRDGAYTASAVCEVYEYKVTVTSTFADGLLTDLTCSTDNKLQMNESFISKAWSKMKTRIFKKQTGDVDTVSGATYTSTAIRTAYIKTLNKAIGDGKDQEEDNKPDEEETQETETETQEEEETEETEEEDENRITLERNIKGDKVTYTGYTDVDAEDAEKNYAKGLFENYRIKAEIVFENGAMSSFRILAYEISDDVSDSEYTDDLNYSESVMEALTSKLDVVSGATCSSKALLRFYKAAKKEYDAYLKELADQEETEESGERESETESEPEKETNIPETEKIEIPETEKIETPETGTSKTEKTEDKETEESELRESETDKKTESEKPEASERETMIETETEEERS